MKIFSDKKTASAALIFSVLGLSFFSLLYYFSIISDKNKNGNKVDDSTQLSSVSTSIIDTAKQNQSNRELLLSQIEIIKNTSPHPTASSLEDIQAKLIMFTAWAKMTEELYSDPIAISLRDTKLKKALIKLQERDYPLLRKAYANVCKEKLWENNIEVKLSGKKNSTLTLTGGLFASNKNIKEVQEIISQMVRDLRFKRINYKWYEYDEEYTYYDLEPAKDDYIRSY